MVLLRRLGYRPWRTVVGWIAFAVSLGWVAHELVFAGPASWTVPGGEDAALALFYEHLIRVLAFTGLGALILTAQPRNNAGLLCLAPVSTPLFWSLPVDLLRFAQSCRAGGRGGASTIRRADLHQDR